MTGMGVAALLLATVVLCTAQPPPYLVCPDPSGQAGLCVEDCTEDSCGDGQLCCSNGCGHVCRDGVSLPVNCSDTQQEGRQFNPTPCESCMCEGGERICAVTACVDPDCGEGLEPYTPEGECCSRCPQLACPNTDGLIGTCVESCSKDSPCEDGQLCCSNGCGHTCMVPSVNCSGLPDGYSHQRTPCETCSCNGGQLRCSRIACDWPQCPDGVTPVTAPGACCPSCPTSCTEGGNTYDSGASWTCSDGCNTCSCSNGQVAMTEIGCPPSCAAVSCREVKCEAGHVAVTPEGECCPSCQDCSSVSCNVRDCGENEQRVYPDTQCCPDCQDCRLVRCAAVECEYGVAFTPEGECCMRCPPEERFCDYRSMYDVSDMDPCVRCECNADFVYECRRVTTGASCSPLSCQLEDVLYPHGTSFIVGCSSCDCRNGVAQCSEKSCSAEDGSGVKLDMGFAGNYDDYKDITVQEELINVLKRQLVSKFRHLNLMDSQVKDVQVYKGSVYVSFTIVAMDGGADPSTVAKTMETEHRSGALLLVSGNQTLVPLSSTFSVVYVAAGGNKQDGSYVSAIAVPVVVGVVAIVAIVAAVVVILYLVKTKHNQPARGKAIFSEGVCSIENVYIAPEDNEKVKWDSSSISSDKAVKV